MPHILFNGPDCVIHELHHKMELRSFPASTSPTGHGWAIHRRRCHVAAVSRQPAQGRHQFRCQFDTLGVDDEALVINPALARNHIQMPAGGLCVEDRAPFVLDLFKAAVSTPPAKGFPFLICNNGICHLFS